MTQIEVSIVCIERLVCMFVSTVSSCFEPRLLISLSDHSLSPFSRSPSRAWSPQGVPQFSDRCVGMAIRRFPPLLFLLPCRFHVLHFCLVDFDRLPLWSTPVVVPLPVPFCSHGINLGFFCWFDWSIYLWCAIRFGRVAFNRSIHEISLVWYAVWLDSEFRLCPLIFCICFAIGFSSLDFFLIVDVIGFIILGFTWSFVVSLLLRFSLAV